MYLLLAASTSVAEAVQGSFPFSSAASNCTTSLWRPFRLGIARAHARDDHHRQHLVDWLRRRCVHLVELRDDVEVRSCGTHIANCPCRRIQTRRSYVSRAYLLVLPRGKIMKESSPIEATGKRATIYARFSTDLQNERSIEDQLSHGGRRLSHRSPQAKKSA